MIEQVFWSTVDKLDVIDHISLTNFMVNIFTTDIMTISIVGRILWSCLRSSCMLKCLYKET